MWWFCLKTENFEEEVGRAKKCFIQIRETSHRNRMSGGGNGHGDSHVSVTHLVS
jgi:hypothetical protein